MSTRALRKAQEKLEVEKKVESTESDSEEIETNPKTVGNRFGVVCIEWLILIIELF